MAGPGPVSDRLPLFPEVFAPLTRSVEKQLPLLFDDGEGVALAVGRGWIIAGPRRGVPRVNEAWQHLGWTLPPLLTQVARAADGLGPLQGVPGWFEDGILPVEAMEPLIARVRFGEENILYEPQDWLRFHSDGLGGGWCAHRDGERAARWDAGSHALGPPILLQGALSALVARWVALLGQSR